MTPVLISAAEAAELAARPDVRFVDARSGDDAASRYGAGHLPGAVAVSLDRDLAAAVSPDGAGGRHPLPDPLVFGETLGRLGITPATEVVVYDDQGGANAAARLWWMLRAIGHERVRVLDGGLAAAAAAGLTPVPGLEASTPAAPYPVTGFARPTAGVADVDAARGDPARLVIDVRSGPRYRGETEPFDRVAGHIPGVQNAPYAENLQPDGRFKPAAELRSLYERLLGGRSPDELIVHCGSGVTACHTLLALEHAGLPGAALYVGSWSDWVSDRSRPVARGV